VEAEGARMRRRHRRLRNRPAKGDRTAEKEIFRPSDRVPQNTRGRVSLPRSNLCQQAKVELFSTI
jgi:hypothetical protein